MAALNGRSGTKDGDKAVFSRIPAVDGAQGSASSGMAAGERNRTDAFDLCRTCEDAPSSHVADSHAESRAGGAMAMALTLALALLAGSASAQVKLTLGGDLPATGPGTKYPTLMTCNETNLPQQVDGWKFKTKDFAGFTTWMPNLTKSGTAPVEYTQKVPTEERQMQAGNCRIAPTDYTGTLAAGQDATPFDLQALIKTGSCTEVPPYKDADGLTCAEIDAVKPDYGSQCIIDSIGSNGGDNYGGFVSSFYGQTQIQAAIPSNSFQVSGDEVRWNPYAMGPQYMMALGMAQEIMNVDMQFLTAIAGKETGAGIQSVATGAVRSELPDYQDNGTYSYWQIEQDTYGTYIKAYPQFFPKYGPCVSKYPDVTSAISAGHCVDSWGTVAKFYMQPAGKTKMTPNSPQITNGALSSAIAWYGLYDALSNSTDLCFVEAIKNGVDKRIAFAAMIGGYNLGRYTDFGGPLKDPNLKNDPNASAKFATGNNNYRPDIYRILDNLVGASKNCASRKIYDTTITLNEMQRFLFGGSVTAGTVAAQGDGGLMLHFPLTTEERQALWDDVTCAYNKLKGKAPSTIGKDAISYRYDYLTLLRVVKKHLPFHIKDRKIPVEHDFQYVVDTYSKNPQTCSGKKKDDVYPSMSITSPAANSVVSPVIAPGAKFVFSGTDNVAVSKAEWTFDKNWLAWNPATKTAGNTYEFSISCERPDYPKKNSAASLWVRTTDDCGNSTVQQFDFRTHSTANCGDPPVPPQVATPLATPPGREFSALTPGVRVTLDDATSGASILYTLDGSDPDSVVGGKTVQYSGPILITATTVLKARGVMDGMSASSIMTETYTKVQPGKVATPTATPPGKTFTGSLSVILQTATPGATIYYTLDGTIPDSSGAGAKKLTAPIVLTADATITAIAVKDGMYRSDVMVEKYSNIPPVAVKQAWYLDENGDGRIEKAIVEFASALPAVPAKLGFKITDESNQDIARNASGAEITLAPGNAARAVVVFTEPFPQGVTSLKNAAASGQTFHQDAIPLNDGVFAVADSVAPVIVSAEVKEPGDGAALKRVLITYSEAVAISAGGQPLTFKRESAETPGSSVILANVEKLSERDYAFHVDSNSTFYPIVGDSAAITVNGQTADAGGMTPKAKFFRVLKGVPPKAKPVSLKVTFPNGSQLDASSGSAAANRPGLAFIPVDKDGNALAKCPGCVAKDSRGYVGPVFVISTPGPVDYTFKIFNNFGEFVIEGKGKVESGDLSQLKRSGGINYEAPVVWTGATRSGTKASTGAYILIATFLSEKDMTSGAGPGQFTEKKVFGMLRN
ncbi:MAG: hypothetical protein JWP91_2923 [Fibrobacteres bacterium]|nr:hypothetical protein [Fibrobacterota bacterium]